MFMSFHCYSNWSRVVCVARQLHVSKKFQELSVRSPFGGKSKEQTNKTAKPSPKKRLRQKFQNHFWQFKKCRSGITSAKNHLSIALSYFISFTLRISFTDHVSLSLPLSSDSSQDAKQCERAVYLHLEPNHAPRDQSACKRSDTAENS